MKQQAPKLHGLDLATDETVSLAWIEFFAECRRLAAISRQRRSTKACEMSKTAETADSETEAA